jgi:CRISPR-associated protein Csm5
MTYRLTALTPLLVGGGQKLSPIDYMVWKDNVNVLDQARIFKLLSRGPRLEGYLTQLKRAERLEFAAWGGFAQNFAGRRIPFEHPSAAGYLDRARGDSLFIPLFHTGPQGHYIPGSAIKGALRTGMVFSRWSAGTIRDLAGRIDKERAPRRPADSAEQQALGTPGHNRLRFFSVADSITCPATSFNVYLLRTATFEQRGNRLELGWKTSPRGSVDSRRVEDSTAWFAEMARPGTTFEGQWREPAIFRSPHVLECLRWRDLPERTHLLSAVNRYATALLDLHRTYAERAGLPLLQQSVDSLLQKLAAIRESSNACVFSLGWGGGLLSKSAFLETSNEDYRSLLKLVPLYSRAIATGLPFPKTRKIIFLGNQPATLPGWTLLEFPS